MKATTPQPGSAAWKEVPLGSVAEFIMGQAPPGSACNKAGTGEVFVKAGEFGATHPVVREWTTKPLKHAKNGDVLICVVGATAGKLNLAIDCAIGRSVAAIRPSDVTFDKFLFYQLMPKVESLRAASAGSAQGVISKAMLADIGVVLAPLEDQRRIVEEIERQLTRLEAGVAALKRSQANIKRYRASTLKAACEGRLVPTEAELARCEGRPYEPASVLLERIKAEKAKLVTAPGRGRQRRDNGAPLPPDLRPLPEGWEWSTLGEIAALKGGVTKSQQRKPGDGMRLVPYLRVANVQRGFIDLTEVLEIAATDEEIAELSLRPGDVLFNEGGDRDKLGRGWVWSGEIEECIHQNHVFRARFFSSALQPKYISWYGNSAGQTYFVNEGKQTTNLASVNLSKLSSLPVPLPPAEEQRRIVAEVERRLSFADDLDRIASANLHRATRLRQSILKAALSGKLTEGAANENA